MIELNPQGMVFDPLPVKLQGIQYAPAVSSNIAGTRHLSRNETLTLTTCHAFEEPPRFLDFYGKDDLFSFECFEVFEDKDRENLLFGCMIDSCLFKYSLKPKDLTYMSRVYKIHNIFVSEDVVSSYGGFEILAGAYDNRIKTLELIS